MTIELSPGVFNELARLARPFEDKTPEDVIVRLLRERGVGNAEPRAGQ
jgi:hypothetical protein